MSRVTDSPQILHPINAMHTNFLNAQGALLKISRENRGLSIQSFLSSKFGLHAGTKQIHTGSHRNNKN